MHFFMCSQVFKAKDNYSEINKGGIIHVSSNLTSYLRKECLVLDKNGCHTMDLETLLPAAPLKEHYFNFYLHLRHKCMHDCLRL